MSLDRIDLDSSKLIISLMISLEMENFSGNGKATSDGTCFLFLVYLGRFQFFLLHLTPGDGEG